MIDTDQYWGSEMVYGRIHTHTGYYDPGELVEGIRSFRCATISVTSSLLLFPRFEIFRVQTYHTAIL